MRQYQPIWNKLKSLPLQEASKKGVSVTANRALHSRIIKAVIKEKWIDIGYKLEMEPRKMIMEHTVKHAVITFYLRIAICSINEELV